MRRAFGLLAISALVAGWIACSSEKDPEPTPVLEVKTFDVVEAGWGDAPLPVHFVWTIASNTGRSLTCKLDLDGDGAFDKEIEGCKSDTTTDAVSTLPTFTFAKVGEHVPRLVVTDGERTVEATQKIFANRLEFAKTTIFPEKLSGFVKAEVTPMTKVVLTFDDPSRVPDVKPGDILWGTSGFGYLLEVESASKSGSTLTATGKPGAIDKAVENGFFGARDVVAPMNDARCLDDADCADLTFQKITDADAPNLGTKSLGRSAQPLTLEGKGTFGLKVPLPGSDSSFEHNLFVGLTVKEFVLEVSWFKLKRATLDMRPGFAYDFAAKKEVSKSFRLGTISLGTIPIGPVIVTPVVLPTVKVAIGMKIGATMGLNLPLQIKYDGGWSAGLAPELKGSIAELFDPNTVSASAYAKASFIPKVNALIMGIAGPYVGPTATLTVEGKVQTAPASDLEKCGFPYQLCFSAKVGAGGEYGAELPWVSGASLSKSFSVAEAIVWQKCLGKPDEKGACPPSPPNVDAAPPPPSDGGSSDATTGDATTDDAASDAAPDACPASGPPMKPECAKCEHGVCTEGTALAPTCSACTKKVCEADEYCCTQRWTLSCMQKANELCGAGCKI